MIHFSFLLYIISFAAASVSIIISILIYLRYRKKGIIFYSLLLGVVTLLLIYRMILCYLEIFPLTNGETITLIALIIKKTAFVVGLFSGPYFTYTLIGKPYAKKTKIVINTVGAGYLITAVIELILYPGAMAHHLRMYIGIPILFGVFAYHLVLSALYIGKLGDKTLNITLKMFFVAALSIFPFSLIQYFTQTPYLPNFIEIPLFFIVLNIFTIIFSFKYLNHPAYFEENRLSLYFKEKFKITDRENEIISLVIKGLSNNAIAEKLFISARTVESHLYKIFQKSSIKNRAQLINLIMSNRK